jgi:hypothetical protein
MILHFGGIDVILNFSNSFDDSADAGLGRFRAEKWGLYIGGRRSEDMASSLSDGLSSFRPVQNMTLEASPCLQTSPEVAYGALHASSLTLMRSHWGSMRS